MPAFKYKAVLLHQLPDGQGWHILGIRHNKTQELIAMIAPAAGEALTEKWANMAAINLAGKPYAEPD